MTMKLVDAAFDFARAARRDERDHSMTLEEFGAALRAAEAWHEKETKRLEVEHKEKRKHINAVYVGKYNAAHRRLDRMTGAAAKEFSKTPEGKAYIEEHFPKTY